MGVGGGRGRGLRGMTQGDAGGGEGWISGCVWLAHEPPFDDVTKFSLKHPNVSIDNARMVVSKLKSQ